MRGKWRAQRADGGAHAACGFVCGATALITSDFRRKISFQCRTRLCVWCNVQASGVVARATVVSMPHAALWVVQQSILLLIFRNENVSMPHAALWVVQRWRHRRCVFALYGFQCRTRLCGWCNLSDCDMTTARLLFQCRTRLFPFAPTTASRSPSPAHAGEAWLRAVFSQNHAISASPADAGEVASAASR